MFKEKIYNIEIQKINIELSKKSPFNRVEWAVNTFGSKFCVTSSFGIQAAIMVHIISEVDKSIPVLFLDTGYHFAETLAYKQYLKKMFNLNIMTIRPELTRMEFEQKYGYANEVNHDLCCKYNKVIPLKNALRDIDCWGTGIRQTQGENREHILFLVHYFDEGKPMYKLAPLADYKDSDVEFHYKLYNLPLHPLSRKGYTSVGCGSCTEKIMPGEDTRAGRWRGKEKTECGIHPLKGQGDGI